MEHPIPSGFFAASGTAHASGATSHRDLHVDRGAVVHPHFCDCCGCLNGSGGLVLPGAGVVAEDEGHRQSRLEREHELELRKKVTARQRARRAAA